jgi:hypothetical protein
VRLAIFLSNCLIVDHLDRDATAKDKADGFKAHLMGEELAHPNSSSVSMHIDTSDEMEFGVELTDAPSSPVPPVPTEEPEYELEYIDGSENWGNSGHSDGEPVASEMELAPSTADAPTAHMPPTSLVSTTAPLTDDLGSHPVTAILPAPAAMEPTVPTLFSTSNDATSTPAGPSAKISRPDWEPAMVAGVQSRFGRKRQVREAAELEGFECLMCGHIVCADARANPSISVRCTKPDCETSWVRASFLHCFVSWLTTQIPLVPSEMLT